MVSSYIAHIQCSVRFTHITPGHWTCPFLYHFNSFLEQTAFTAISVLGTNHRHCHICSLGTHLHLSQVKHVRVKCLAQEHNIA